MSLSQNQSLAKRKMAAAAEGNFCGVKLLQTRSLHFTKYILKHVGIWAKSHL